MWFLPECVSPHLRQIFTQPCSSPASWEMLNKGTLFGRTVLRPTSRTRNIQAAWTPYLDNGCWIWIGVTSGCVYTVRRNVNLGQKECVGHRNRAAVSSVKYIWRLKSFSATGCELFSGTVIHSEGLVFQMIHPLREMIAQSSPSTFPCLYKGH